MEMMPPSDSPPRQKRRQHGKSIEERVAYAVSHKTRIHLLTILNEGTHNPDEIAATVGESRGNVAHHIRELLDAGCIELAKSTRGKYGSTQHYYRAVEQPLLTDDEFAGMDPEDRQAVIGLTIQCYMAEVMWSFWARKMSSDPRFFLTWGWLNLDDQGKDEVADELRRTWERVQQIEVDSINRCAQSGDDQESIIVGMAGFPRARTSPEPMTREDNAN